MVGRARCCSERAHLLNEERHEGLGIDESLCFLIEVSLVGRAAAFGNEEEVVFIAFGGMDVNLGGEVATGVYLVVHVEGSVLAVTKVVGGVGEVYAFGDAFLVVASCEYVLALGCMHDGCTGVLAEG